MSAGAVEGTCGAADDPEYSAAFQGAPGAFSEEVAFHFVGGMDPLGELRPLLPCERFDGVFDAVEEGRVRLGVLPVENTLTGSVVAVNDLLLQREVRIVGEAVLRISHFVSSRPGATLTGLRRILSHPVALAQCEDFLRRHPWIEAVPVYDTAGAVAQVMAGDELDTGALGSRRAAELHGATILASEVEDDPENYTRFLAIGRDSGEVPWEEKLSEREGKISLAVTLTNRPGALHAALAPLAARGLDLTRIESRPLRGRPFEYVFFIDLAGEGDPCHLKQALAELRRLAVEVKFLGRYAGAREAVRPAVSLT